MTKVVLGFEALKERILEGRGHYFYIEVVPPDLAPFRDFVRFLQDRDDAELIAAIAPIRPVPEFVVIDDRTYMNALRFARSPELAKQVFDEYARQHELPTAALCDDGLQLTNGELVPPDRFDGFLITSADDEYWT